MWRDLLVFSWSSTDGRLGCLHLGALTNHVAVNICVQVSAWTCVFIPRGEMLRGGVAGHVVTQFSHVRNQDCSCRGCTAFRFPRPRARVPVSPHPHRRLPFSVLLFLFILEGVKWYLTVVLICIFPTTVDAGPRFTCSSAIRGSPWENCLSGSFVHL